MTTLYTWKNDHALSKVNGSLPGTFSFTFSNTNKVSDPLKHKTTPIVTPTITIDFKNSKIDYQINPVITGTNDQTSMFEESGPYNIPDDDNSISSQYLHEAITSSDIYKLTDDYKTLEWKLKDAERNSDSNINNLSGERDKLINDLKSQMKKVKDDENKINNLHTMNIVLIVTSCVLLIALIILLFIRGKKKGKK
jgi:hypothetical protein